MINWSLSIGLAVTQIAFTVQLVESLFFESKSSDLKSDNMLFTPIQTITFFRLVKKRRMCQTCLLFKISQLNFKETLQR